MNKILCDEVTIDSPYFIYWENSKCQVEGV